MTPERKLNIASVLMIAGLVPLLLGSLFGLYVESRKMDEAEALTLFLIMLVAYPIAICVSGAAMLWAFVVHRCNAPYRSRRAAIMSRIVLISLAAPIFYMSVIRSM